MSRTLACIHTTLVFINVETMMNDLFREILPEVRRINIVDDSLLPQCMEAGGVTPPIIARMCAYLQCAQTAGADAVFSLCSSLGPAIDVAKQLVSIPVIKIDDAMTEAAVDQGQRIGVMATVPTTLGPTVALTRQKAAEQGKTIEVTECLVAGAFGKLMAGAKAEHDQMVLEAAAKLGANVDVILFAQASMTRLVSQAQQVAGRPVLSSPRLGIQHARRVLEGLEAPKA